MPPIWGVAHGQWAGVFFLPAWAFVDNVVRGGGDSGAWSTALGAAMVAATLALQVLFAMNADKIAWSRVAANIPFEVYLRRQRYWALGSLVMAIGMAAWIYAYISRYGMALPAK